MSFFGIGTFEFFTILIIALLIFGPGRLPELMGDAGRMLRDFRRYSRELTGDFQESVRDVRQTYEEIESDMRTTAQELQRDTNEIARSVNETAEEATRLDTLDTEPKRSGGRQPRPAQRARSRTRATASKRLDQAELTPTEDGAEDRVQSESPAPAPQPAGPARKRSQQADPDDLLSVEDDVDDLLGGAPVDDEGTESESDESPKSST